LPALVFGQGFGAVKKSVTLERRLPAAVKLPGSSFSVRATAESAGDSCKALAADKLQSTVEADLIQNNPQLSSNPTSPDAIIGIRVLNCYADAKPEYSMQFGKNANRPPQPTGYRILADLSVTYEARTRAGSSIDAAPINVKYNRQVSAATEVIAGFKRKPDDEPHTREEVLQMVAGRVAQLITARLVNTNERVEALLGRGGPLDEANRYADAAQWTTYIETLETMTPFPKPADDAYRIYNVGVANEALGYKAESPAAAQKYFERAVIQYRKAEEANPHEKYFIQPVNRIEVALEHYKKLEQAPPSSPAPAAAPVSSATPAPPTMPAVPPPQAAAAAVSSPTTWRITEVINGAPVVWMLYANADASFRATMGEAVVANGSWQSDPQTHALTVRGTNLVLRQPFRCTFSPNPAEPGALRGICLDHVGIKYPADAVRR
jgi:hypothetical protein